MVSAPPVVPLVVPLTDATPIRVSLDGQSGTETTWGAFGVVNAGDDGLDFAALRRDLETAGTARFSDGHHRVVLERVS